MKDEEKKSKDLDLSKVLATSLAYTKKQLKKTKEELVEGVKEILDPVGVGIVMEGRHLCMQMRGVEKQNSFATTSAMLGQFRESVETRSEFLSIIRMKQF